MYDLDAALKQVDAEKDICAEYGKAIKRVLRALCGEKREETYSVGQWFAEKGGDKYVLVSVGPDRVLLVHPGDGSRWGCPISVKDPWRITVAEFSMFVDNDNFTRIERP